MQFLKNFNAGASVKTNIVSSTGTKNSYFSSLNQAY
jgi:hypothetical protein